MAKKYKYVEDFRINGVRYKVRANTKTELRKKKEKKIFEIERGQKTISKQMLFSEWVSEWLSVYKEPVISPESLDSYKSVIRCHILADLGNMPLSTIKAIHLQKTINKMAGGSKKMINRVCELLAQIMRDAYLNGLTTENLSEHLNKPKGTVSHRRALTESERAYVLQVAKYHRGGNWVMLMLFAGLRPAEAAAVQWNHINFEEHSISIQQAAKRKGTIGSPKSNAGIRKIPLADPLYDHLIAQKNKHHDPFGFVCTNTRGERLKSGAMQKLWNSFKNELNIAMGCKVSGHGDAVPPYKVADDLVPYCFRHTFCTDLQDAGVPINIARELMGHEDIAITSKIYTHHSQVSFKNTSELINAYQNTIINANKTPNIGYLS